MDLVSDTVKSIKYSFPQSYVKQTESSSQQKPISEYNNIVDEATKDDDKSTTSL